MISLSFEIVYFTNYGIVEAKYSANLKKEKIFLHLQDNYKPSGWLGIILEDHKYLNFRKSITEEMLKDLKKHIDHALRKGKSYFLPSSTESYL